MDNFLPPFWKNANEISKLAEKLKQKQMIQPHDGEIWYLDGVR